MITLQTWMDNGGCNLSNACRYDLCRRNNLSEAQLRQMTLPEIFALKVIPADIHNDKPWAERQLSRFWREHPNQITGPAWEFASEHLT